MEAGAAATAAAATAVAAVAIVQGIDAVDKHASSRVACFVPVGRQPVDQWTSSADQCRYGLICKNVQSFKYANEPRLLLSLSLSLFLSLFLCLGKNSTVVTQSVFTHSPFPSAPTNSVSLDAESTWPNPLAVGPGPNIWSCTQAPLEKALRDQRVAAAVG